MEFSGDHNMEYHAAMYKARQIGYDHYYVDFPGSTF